MAVTCSNCSNQLPDDARFCSECGTTVAVEEIKPVYCINCFAELSENAKFCLHCGKPAVVADTGYFSSFEKDQSIFKELVESSPEKENYRKYQTAHKAWEARLLENWSYELEAKEPEMNYNYIVDFEKNRTKISLRVREWVKYETGKWERIQWFQALAANRLQIDVDHAWSNETCWFRTNKPNHHKALFYEIFIDQYIYELQRNRALSYDNPPVPTPLFQDYLRKIYSYTEKALQEFELEMPNMEEIKKWPRKDDELFPPPQPVRVEVAGAIVNFTTDEAVVVVYMDYTYLSREIELKWAPGEELVIEWQKIPVIARSIGENTICAAISRPIPLVTDEMKNLGKVINQAKAVILASCTEPTTRKEIILFKGNITECDLRGYIKPEPVLSEKEKAQEKQKLIWDFFHKIDKGDFPTVKAMLEANKDLLYTKHATTPLRAAIIKGHMQIVQLLLQNGADVNEPDSDKSTPLHIAATHGHTDIVAFLIRNGANVNVHGYMQNTPLHTAAWKGDEGIALLLLNNGALVNARDQDKSTPLHIATSSNHVEFAKVLLQKGADANTKNKHGWTPLYNARTTEMKTLLRSHGAVE